MGNFWKINNYPKNTHSLPNPSKTNKLKKVRLCSRCKRYWLESKLLCCSYPSCRMKFDAYCLDCLKPHYLSHE